MIVLMRPLWELLVLMLANILLRANSTRMPGLYPNPVPLDTSYCLSWRVGVEANNIRYFHTIPFQCIAYVEKYMIGGQYNSDVNVVVEQMFEYLSEIMVSDDGKDAWVFDIDDTCLSNLFYYEGKNFGGEPYDPLAFRSWAQRGMCTAIPEVLGVYRKLIESGFKVFLLTGRDEELLGSVTAENLFMQGFVGHERLIMRSQLYKGLSAVIFKSAIRKQLVEEGYRIRGNVGDQWSDLSGEYVGDRTFKLPNPMYFVP